MSTLIDIKRLDSDAIETRMKLQIEKEEEEFQYREKRRARTKYLYECVTKIVEGRIPIELKKIVESVKYSILNKTDKINYDIESGMVFKEPMTSEERSWCVALEISLLIVTLISILSTEGLFATIGGDGESIRVRLS